MKPVVKYPFLFLALLMLIPSLTGCGALPFEADIVIATPIDSYYLIPRNKEQRNNTAAEEDILPQSYTVLYESNEIPLALYEPADGCYLGAQLSQTEEDGINNFERQTLKKHAVYVYEMRLNDEFPEYWILNCIAAQAVPLVVLHPSGSGPVFTVSELTQIAAAFGSYNIPLFVAFFPLNAGNQYDAATYTLYYRYARAIFLEQAPQAAFVWLADAGLENTDVWYPGDESVDWVGLSAFKVFNGSRFQLAQPKHSQSQPPQLEQTDGPDLLTRLETFYYRYQSKKPVMLVPLAVSHFSSRDYIYHTRDAAAELLRIYTALEECFPRIKLIAYMDINGLLYDSGIEDDYSVTQEETLLEAYRQCIDNRRFLSKLETAEGNRAGGTHNPGDPEWLRSTYAGYEEDGKIYIDVRILTDEMKLSPPKDSLWINEIRCTDVRLFESGNDIYAVIDHEQKIIWLYRRIS